MKKDFFKKSQYYKTFYIEQFFPILRVLYFLSKYSLIGHKERPRSSREQYLVACFIVYYSRSSSMESDMKILHSFSYTY